MSLQSVSVCLSIVISLYKKRKKGGRYANTSLFWAKALSQQLCHALVSGRYTIPTAACLTLCFKLWDRLHLLTDLEHKHGKYMVWRDKKKVYVNTWMENIVLWISGLCTCYVCFDKPALTFCYGNILHCGLSWYKIIIIHVGFFLKLLIRILHNASLRELLIIMWIEKLIISFLFLAENLNNSKVRINWLLGAMCCNF